MRKIAALAAREDPLIDITLSHLNMTKVSSVINTVTSKSGAADK